METRHVLLGIFINISLLWLMAWLVFTEDLQIQEETLKEKKFTFGQLGMLL